MSTVYYMPKRFCPGMPTVRLELAGGARAIDLPQTPAKGTPEYDAYIERIKDENRRERIAAGCCFKCGTPSATQPCAACVLARFTRLAGIES